MFVLLGFAALALYAVTQSKQGVAVPSSNDGPKTDYTDLPQPEQSKPVNAAPDLLNQVLPALPSALPVLGAGAVLALNAAVAIEMGKGTIVPPIAIGSVAVVAPLGAIPGALGAQLGKTVTQIFGGQDVSIGLGLTGEAYTDSTSTVAQIGGFITGATLGAAAPLAIIAFAIASALSDAERLKYGQAGAARDYWAAWFATYESVYVSMRTDPKTGVADADYMPAIQMEDGTVYTISDNELANGARAYVDGFLRKRNQLNFQQWMLRPWGVGMNRTAHASYGAARGYFVGLPNNEGTALQSNPPRYTESEYGQSQPDTVKAGYWGETVTKQVPRTVTNARVTYTVYDAVEYASPRAHFEESGAVGGNVRVYVAIAKIPLTAGQSEASQLTWYKNAGWFDGSVVEGWKLSYSGKVYDHKALLPLATDIKA